MHGTLPSIYFLFDLRHFRELSWFHRQAIKGFWCSLVDVVGNERVASVRLAYGHAHKMARYMAL